MLALDLTYKRITNDAGHLPATWEADVEKMFVRIAYLVMKHAVPRDLLLNLDETPLP